MKQSRMIKQAMAVAIALGLTGCAVKQAPSIQAPDATSKLGSTVKLSGTLRISIKWPSRSYNTALLPDSTNRIVLAVTKTTEGVTETVAQKEITRAASQTTVNTSLVVQAGSGYDIAVDGYRDTILVAHGAASGVTIKAGAISNVPAIVMTASTAPAINSVVNNASGQSSVAKVGDTITLNGTNLGAEASLSLQVSLNGAAIPTENITRVGTGSIQVVVPDSATCGTMSVKVDNIAAATNNPLWIVNSVSFSPATASIRNHTNYTLEPTIGWVLSGTDTANKFGTPPDPQYTVNPDTQGTVTNGNLFTATATSFGPVNITPKMGSLVGDSIAVTVLPSITSVTLNATEATINATSDGTDPSTGDPSSFTFVATVHGDGYNQGVIWTSNDPSIATVDANGVVTANNNGAGGTVTITATSKDDDTQEAQATVTVTNNGEVNVGVH